ncbi:TPA: hypothetical protein I9148_002138 [Clostridium perfringens]|nr:hypothetical protein [Clostridium perfringens]
MDVLADRKKVNTRKKTKIFKTEDVVRVAWSVKTFDEDRYIKVSMSGLFVQIGNFKNFKTIDELYPEIRNIVDSKGLIVAKRKSRNSGLAYCKDKGIMIPA